jgi:hypothetical protein
MAAPGHPERPAELLDAGVALRPGRGDAVRLLTLWLVRRSFTWLLFLGIVVGIFASEAANEDADLFVDTSSADAVARGVFTRFGLVFGAIVIRVLVQWVAIVLAYPVARANEVAAPRPRSWRGRLDARLDRLELARAFTALRWTRPVRDAAVTRLGPDAARYRLADRSVGGANVASIVVCALAIVVFGARVQL